ncbi:histidine phosphatase family protein [Saccharibacillus sp. CPCC 101409]|uniref:histidine phosphatase family protein n=1 Tax=Saccharibacillus sp. CPCC 101409 TaxID=3058041 RepID=UPI0026714AC0|nr:histidine phosphatase family protein [Saccharibacillus sp. CPCC 101409]MDO3413382.1 histidine phosphatase family protein [Saccharibacillus sp. CPCC 101409]
MSKKVNVYLIRHGETYLNRYGRMQGWSDSPLTDEGRTVAVATGQKLADTKFAYVYTSDSGRTLETAEIILKENRHSVPVINRTKAFRETFFGGFEGELSKVALTAIAEAGGIASFEELRKNCTVKELADLTKKADPYGHAEDFDELWTRIKGGLDDVVGLDYEDGANILVVTHGNTIRNILNQMCEGFDVTVEIRNASVTILEYADDKYGMVCVNQ